MLLFAMLLFPTADKALHDFEHLGDVHCGIKEIHYCEAEHVCSLCDYVFSAASEPPKCKEHLSIFFENYNYLLQANKSFPITHRPYTLSLRGPPTIFGCY